MLTIILEGENKTGKSTLAAYLNQKHGFKIVKCNQPKGDPYVEYMQKLERASGRTVFDRFHLGEIVYGTLYRGGHKLDPIKLRNIELLAKARNAVLVHCYDTPKNIAKRFEEDGEEFAHVDLIKPTVDMFSKLAMNSSLETFHHSMKSDFDMLASGLINDLVNSHDYDIPRYGQVVGNTHLPRMLLVGDTRNLKNSKYNDVGEPFDFGVSSRFLFDALLKAKIPLPTIAIANSDSPGLRSLLSLTRPPCVVALGRNASQRLTEFNQYHVKLNHPNYENRFHHHDSTLAADLKKLYKKYEHLR